MKNALTRYQKKKQQKKQQVVAVKAKYSYLQAFFYSLFNPDLFIDVRQAWKGYGFLYILTASVIFSVPWASTELYRLKNYFGETVTPSVQQLPDIHIRNGQFYFNKPSPVLIKNRQGEVSIVLDNKSTLNFLKKRYDKAFLIIHQDEFITKLPNMSAQSEKLIEETNGTLTPATVLARMADIKKLLFWTMYPTMVCAMFVIYNTYLFLFSMTANFLSSIMLKYRLTFRHAYRLAAVSSTPGFILMFAFYLPGYGGIKLGLVTFFVAYGYYLFAAFVNRSAQRDLMVV